MNDELIETALARQECVLLRAGVRRVLLLDGSSVITEGDGAGREKHLNASAAKEGFRAAILAALEAGFTPAPRDAPKKSTFVQPQRAPDAPTFVPPAPPAPVLPPRRPTSEWPDTWTLHENIVQVRIDPFDGAEWEPLHQRQPPGVDFIDIEGETPEEAVELVLEGGLPSWTRGLGLLSFDVVEDYCAAELDPTRLWSALGSLTALDLRSGSRVVIPSSLPSLQRLGVFTSEATLALVQQLTASTWSSLTELELFLDSSELLDGTVIARALTKERFPALRHLALRGTRFDDDTLEALKPLGLASLVLSHGETDDHAVGVPTPFAEPVGIEVLSEGRFYPLRSSRFS
ncbi:MAG: hypothetical protein JNM69_29385 [Archangium sp.]|nr:hypothetical protein [Archangium sp.]